MPFLRPVGVVSLNAYPCLRRNFDSRCLQRFRSSRASSGARPRSRADAAVAAQRRAPLLQVAPGHARLVDALRGRVEGFHPLCDGCRVVGEGGRADLAGHRIEGDGLYGSRVHVEADEGGSIQHERAPFHACGVAATFELDTHIVGLIHGFAYNRGSQCFYVLLISSLVAHERHGMWRF